MFWVYLVVGIFGYLFFKEGVLKKLEELKKWWRLNKGKIVEWQKNQEIMTAFKSLERAIKDAQMDRKWDYKEILLVLSLAGKLISLIKKYEEENK